MIDLVTGASGFLGSHLAEALTRQGRRVRALVRRTSRRAELDRVGVEYAEGSLDEPGALQAAARGAERIFHCAALAADWGAPAAFREANVAGLGRLLEAAADAGVARFVHVSTTDVYGHPDRPVAEDAPFVRRGFAYGDSKVDAEELLWRFAGRTGLPVTVVRPANVFGPRSESFVVEALRLLRRRQMVLVGPPDAPAGLGYVANVVDALLLAGTAPAATGEAFNVHDGEGITWHRYLTELAIRTGSPAPRLRVRRRLAYAGAAALERAYRAARASGRPPITRMIVEVLGTNQEFSTEKLRTRLGFAPRVSFDEGMDRVVAWLRSAHPF